jgi:hypothetical protein
LSDNQCARVKRSGGAGEFKVQGSKFKVSAL